MPQDWIPFHRPTLGPEEEQEVLETLRSGWLTTGPRCKRLEADFSVYTGAPHAVAVNSCTAALHVALLALGIGAGDEVITSTITFPATANVIFHCGATPVLVDVEPGTLNMDVAAVAAAVTPRTRAIIPVHFAGHPVDMDPILELAERHGLAVVDDAAHAVESVYKGRKVGSMGTATAFSFYATKNVTTAEGGMLTTASAELADQARILSLHGISKDAWKRYTAEGYQHWETLEAGFKYNLSDVQAAIGIHQLRKVDAMCAERRRVWEAYRSRLAGQSEFVLLDEHPAIRHACHLFVVRVRPDQTRMSRDQILAGMQAQGIGMGVHFRALHLQPLFERRLQTRRGMFPVAEAASDTLFSLPLYPTLPTDTVHQICDRLIALVRGAAQEAPRPVAT